jgi:hypothetical protein
MLLNLIIIFCKECSYKVPRYAVYREKNKALRIENVISKGKGKAIPVTGRGGP